MISRLFLIVISLALSIVAHAGDRPTMVLNELLIGLHDDVDAQSYFGDEWANARQIGNLKTFQLKVDAPTEDAVRAECVRRAADPRVKWAEPNGIVYFELPPIGGIASPVTIDNPPVFHNPSLPYWFPGIKEGQYGGTVSVEKSVPAFNLTQKYALRAQANVSREAGVTILTSTMQGPASVSANGAEAAVRVIPHSGEDGNCRVDGQFIGRIVPTRSGFTLKYEVPADPALNKPAVTFEFTFKLLR